MKTQTSLAILVADLGYGDAGKGSLVDALVRRTRAHTVVRYNGGAQAAHNVVTPDGRHHTFAQFGSGTFVPGAHTHLSRYMLIHPTALLAEERHLAGLGVRDGFNRLSIDREALVITPFQQAANRLKEILRGAARHGSCGMGIGETMSDWLAYRADVLLAGDLSERPLLVRKLRFLRDAKWAQLEPLLAGLLAGPQAAAELRLFSDPGVVDATADLYQHLARQVRLVDRGELERRLSRPGTVIFEGAQGVLLDEWWGFYPYNSWSSLTFANAETLLDESGYGGERCRLGMTRAYATRHGAGPFASEDPALTALLPDAHNTDNRWQRQFRVGYLDLLSLRYALQVCGGVDGLAVTHLDRLETLPEWQLCTAYQTGAPAADLAGHFVLQEGLVTAIRKPADPTDLAQQQRLTSHLMAMRPVYTPGERRLEDYLERISRALAAPVVITSAGMTAHEKAGRWFGKRWQSNLSFTSSKLAGCPG